MLKRALLLLFYVSFKSVRMSSNSFAALSACLTDVTLPTPVFDGSFGVGPFDDAGDDDFEALLSYEESDVIDFAGFFSSSKPKSSDETRGSDVVDFDEYDDDDDDDGFLFKSSRPKSNDETRGSETFEAAGAAEPPYDDDDGASSELRTSSRSDVSVAMAPADFFEGLSSIVSIMLSNSSNSFISNVLFFIK